MDPRQAAGQGTPYFAWTLRGAGTRCFYAVISSLNKNLRMQSGLASAPSTLSPGRAGMAAIKVRKRVDSTTSVPVAPTLSPPSAHSPRGGGVRRRFGPPAAFRCLLLSRPGGSAFPFHRGGNRSAGRWRARARKQRSFGAPANSLGLR